MVPGVAGVAEVVAGVAGVAEVVAGVADLRAEKRATGLLLLDQLQNQSWRGVRGGDSDHTG